MMLSMYNAPVAPEEEDKGPISPPKLRRGQASSDRGVPGADRRGLDGVSDPSVESSTHRTQTQEDDGGHPSDRAHSSADDGGENKDLDDDLPLGQGKGFTERGAVTAYSLP